nr:hypothetical protein [Tanacetum cinerariifolium]
MINTSYPEKTNTLYWKYRRWSLEKHIELVNIIGEPLDGVTTRSRVRDSEAASAHECLYVNFLFEIEPKKLNEALKEEGEIIAMREELNPFKRNKGFRQEKGIDYDETFALVARLEAIKIFLAYAAYMGFMVYQIDVKSAFLNGKILEEVYLQQPPGFENNEFPNHVCKLDKALYGLKQAPGACLDCTKDFVSLPSHKSMKDAIATLGLADEKDPEMMSVDLAQSSSLRIIYFLTIWKGLDIDIAGILFSDLISKLTSGRKKGKKKNICYVRFLSLVIEHLLGDDYVNDNLKPIKPYQITSATFKPSLMFEVPLTSYIRKVTKLSKQPLILPYEEVNVEGIDDKSLSGTTVHPVSKHKAKTDKRQKKKKIPSSSEPIALKIVRDQTPNTQTSKSQPAEETEVQENIVTEAEPSVEKKDDEFVDSKIHYVGHETFKEVEDAGLEAKGDATAEEIMNLYDQKN